MSDLSVGIAPAFAYLLTRSGRIPSDAKRMTFEAFGMARAAGFAGFFAPALAGPRASGTSTTKAAMAAGTRRRRVRMEL
jgi:hypothetical protein